MMLNSLEEKRYYFDWAASSLPLEQTDGQCGLLYGNPSSLHSEGRQAKKALEDARNRCAAVLNVPPQTLFFTSGGTESNSIAIFSTLAHKGRGRVLSSAAEHSSVREAMETLERMGKPTGIIAVDSEGRVTPDPLSKVLEKYGDARFVSTMAVNNETGTVTDIAALNDVMRKPTESAGHLHFHCDLVQAIGKINIDIPSWGIDSASISAHKIGGPRGIGLLYLRRSSSAHKTEVFYRGGGQENGVRGGTENVMGALALADCMEKFANPATVRENFLKADERWKKLINALAAIERCKIIPGRRAMPDSKSEAFSPYILQAAFKDIPGEVMARALDDLGFAVSTGSACSSSSPERPVLSAMGVDENTRIEGIRISQGWTTTSEDIDRLIDAVAEVLKFL